MKLDAATGQLIAVRTVGGQSWIGRFTVDGTMICEATPSVGYTGSVPTSLALDAAGSIVVVSMGDVPGAPAPEYGYREMTVTGNTPAGVEEWRSTYDTGALLVVLFGAATASGDVAVAGRISLDGQQPGAWMRRYDSAGGILWTIPREDLPNVRFEGVVATGEDLIVIGEVEDTEVQHRRIVRRYTQQGQLAWEQTVAADHLSAIDVFEDGGVVVVGSEGSNGWMARLAP